MHHNISVFLYLRENFPEVSDAKAKEGLFVGPQTRKLIKNPVFEHNRMISKNEHGCLFIVLLQIFLVTIRVEATKVESLLPSYYGLLSIDLQHVTENSLFRYTPRFLL